MIYITQHAYTRGRERLGLKPTAFKRLVAMAYCYGVEQKHTKGRLRTFIASRQKTPSSNARVYGENIFVFSTDALITVFSLPTYLKQHAIKSQIKH